MNNGVTWVRVNATPGWSARYSHSSVVMPDGSIILMGGMTGVLMNDVWRSTDNGTTWTEITPSAEWSARAHHSTVVLPDGSIVLMGGWLYIPNDAGTFAAEVGSAATTINFGKAMTVGDFVLVKAYDKTAKDLAARFVKNFSRFKDATAEILAAGPKA